MLTLKKLLDGNKVILLDGALGTELGRRGVDISLPLWSAAALESDPDAVQIIHRDYRRAGAHILIADTFRTTAYTYQLAGQSAQTAAKSAHRLTCLAVALAREAVADDVLVAGSMAPVGDCYSVADYPGRKQARRTFRELAESLAAAAADLALVETQINLEEALLALEAAAAVGLPVMVSFLVDERMRLWGGEPLTQAVAAVTGQGAQAVLVNCVTLDIAQPAIVALADCAAVPFGIYANAGQSQPALDGTITHLHSDEQFAHAALEWVRLGARLVGGCCGTTPATIGLLRRRLGDLALNI